jgi:hypothetical protein
MNESCIFISDLWSLISILAGSAINKNSVSAQIKCGDR